jgi:hypothetical protein
MAELTSHRGRHDGRPHQYHRVALARSTRAYGVVFGHSKKVEHRERSKVMISVGRDQCPNVNGAESSENSISRGVLHLV